MSCPFPESIDLHFKDVLQAFKLDDLTTRRNGVFRAGGFMTRRRISSMPTGMVIAALVIIGLVAFVALFLFGGSAEGALPTVPAVTYAP